MISKARIKWIKSLEVRKYRQEHGAFVAEGPKLVGELLSRFVPLYVAATKEWLAEHGHELGGSTQVDVVSREELARASLLRTPQCVLAVMPVSREMPDEAVSAGQLTLALDGVQDPGNLGTILRVADWFGIRRVLCSEGTADVYNPKCVQSCMGALARVEVYYCRLPETLRAAGVPVFGTFLDGEDIYEAELSETGVIVMGNEGNGISRDVEEVVSHRLLVPNYPQGSLTTESLNVALAAGIVCAEFRRRSIPRRLR